MERLNRRKALQVGVAGAVATASTGAIAGEDTPAPTSKAPTVTPFLTFTGKAERAMKKYVALFADSEIVSIERYGAGEVGKAGTVKVAKFRIGPQHIVCSDSPPVHEWGFTPAISLFVEHSDADAIKRYSKALSAKGKVYMPLGEYPFSKLFAWVEDEFGVSWQLMKTD